MVIAAYRDLVLGLDILHEPFARDLVPELSFFGRLVGAVTDGRELDACADVVQEKTDLLVASPAWNLAGNEIAEFGIPGPIAWLFPAHSRQIVTDAGRLVVMDAAKLRVNGDHIASLQGAEIGLKFADRVVVHPRLQYVHF